MPRRSRLPRRNEKVLTPVQPNAGIRAEYRKRLLRLVAEMQASYVYWIRACYRANEPEMAMDETPAAELARTIRALARRWQRNFNRSAPELARWFLQATHRRSHAALRDILKRAGYSVEFTTTPVMRDVMRASVEENVALIKSIGQQYHTEVQGLVMRSVSRGRDLSGLTRDLEARYGVSRRRAEFIALDQNNKATSAMMAARQTELGIDEGIWQHSHAGKEPRPTHVANDGERFSIKEGWFDPDKRVRRRIWPGELPRCRCTWRPVVKGFS